MSDFNCDSPIEWLLAEHFDQYTPDVDWHTQRPISTNGQQHRVDFYADHAGRRLVIECDGREFHEFWRDRDRDVRMMIYAGVTDVIRFRGSDLVYATDQCVESLRSLAPYLFRDNVGEQTLERAILASIKVVTLSVKPIHRARHPYYELRELPAWMRDADTYTEIISGRDGTIGQFKSPLWDWTYRGPRVLSMGRALELADLTTTRTA